MVNGRLDQRWGLNNPIAINHAINSAFITSLLSLHYYQCKRLSNSHTSFHRTALPSNRKTRTPSALTRVNHNKKKHNRHDKVKATTLSFRLPANAILDSSKRIQWYNEIKRHDRCMPNIRTSNLCRYVLHVFKQRHGGSFQEVDVRKGSNLGSRWNKVNRWKENVTVCRTNKIFFTIAIAITSGMILNQHN